MTTGTSLEAASQGNPMTSDEALFPVSARLDRAVGAFEYPGGGEVTGILATSAFIVGVLATAAIVYARSIRRS